MSSMIEVRDLSYDYGQRKALKNLSFSVKPNEIFGVLGPNGSGKTTLFKLLSTGLLKQASGEMVIGGETTPSKQRQFLGVVFQEPSLDKKLSVLENLKHQGHLYGLYGEVLRKKSDDLLKTVGLLERSHEKIETLSGGLKRRAEIAKSLLHDPKILLLDEPTTGLDPGARKDLWLYLEKLKSRGVTTLVTTHLMDEADRCDRILILHEGEKVAEGAPRDLKMEVRKGVITLTSKNAEVLAPKLKEHFKGEIDTLTLSNPSLEDFYLQKTGHRFWEGKE